MKKILSSCADHFWLVLNVKYHKLFFQSILNNSRLIILMYQLDIVYISETFISGKKSFLFFNGRIVEHLFPSSILSPWWLQGNSSDYKIIQLKHKLSKSHNLPYNHREIPSKHIFRINFKEYKCRRGIFM